MVMARDPFAPRHRIFINNKELPEEILNLIESVTVEDDAQMFDKITIVVNALETTSSANVINLIDSKMFTPPDLIRVDMGYGNVMSTVGAGEIVKVKPRFKREGVQLEVVAYDPFYRLSKTKHRNLKKFPKNKISTVFKTVIDRHSAPIGEFVNEIPPEKDIVRDWDQPIGMSDYEFLTKVAQSKGLDFFNEFDKNTQTFKIVASEPNDKSDPQLTFTYFEHEDEPLKTLLEFFPEMNTNFQVTDIEIKSFNRKTKQKIETYIKTPRGDAKDIKFKGPDASKPFDSGQGSEITFKSFGQTFEIVVNRPFDTEKEAKVYIESCLKERLNGFITGTGTVVGVETLRSRIVIELLGLGRAWDGNYYVNRVTHQRRNDQNYISKIDCRKVVELGI